jgi:acyl-CoA hydrolase
MYEKIAKETSTPLVNDAFSEVLSDRALKSDQVHPNAQGYAQVSKVLIKQLQLLGFIK